MEQKAPDLELLAHDVERSVSRYIEAANKAPHLHANEWDNLMDTGIKLNQFLIRSRVRSVA